RGPAEEGRRRGAGQADPARRDPSQCRRRAGDRRRFRAGRPGLGEEDQPGALKVSEAQRESQTGVFSATEPVSGRITTASNRYSVAGRTGISALPSVSVRKNRSSTAPSGARENTSTCTSIRGLPL